MSVSDDLEKLAALHARGVLSDEEFARAKTRLLNAHRPDRACATVDALNRLQRSRDDRWLGGVCGGLARVTGLAAWMWRLLFASFMLCAGTGAFVYLLLWILLPLDDAAPNLHSERLA